MCRGNIQVLLLIPHGEVYTVLHNSYIAPFCRFLATMNKKPVAEPTLVSKATIAGRSEKIVKSVY